jgi:hypothetical protein
MEERSRNGGKVLVHREFEISRLEQAMLAAAYRRILPDDRLKLVERENPSVNRCNDKGRSASYGDTDSSHHYATAMGGLS